MSVGICGKCGSTYVGSHSCGDDGKAEGRRHALLQAAAMLYPFPREDGGFRNWGEAVFDAEALLAEIERRESAKEAK